MRSRKKGSRSDGDGILVHVRGRMTAEEAAFWTSVRERLNGSGAELYIVAYHPPDFDPGFPILQVPYGLREAGARETQARWTGSFEDSGSPSSAEIRLLERETLWYGPPGDETEGAHRRRALHYYTALYGEILDSTLPSLVVIWNGCHPQEMILASLARNSGIPVMYLERGPIPGTLHLDRRGILGGSAIARSRRWRWNGRLERETWRKRYRKIRNQYRSGTESWWRQPPSVDPARLRDRFSIPQDARILLYAGQVDRDAQNLLFSPHFRSGLEALQFFCRRLPDTGKPLFILGKHHPMSAVTPDQFQAAVGLRGVWTDELNIHDALGLADRVVTVNSTVAFEALLFGKPVLIMGESILSGKKIAYELTREKDAGQVISEWLQAQDWPVRIARWEDFAAYLLAKELFGYRSGSRDGSLRGPGALAEQFLKRSIRRSRSAGAESRIAHAHAAAWLTDMRVPGYTPMRGLFYFPWPLADPSGAFRVLLSHARALRGLGLRLDLFAPGLEGAGRAEREMLDGIFDNIFQPPAWNPALEVFWAHLGRTYHDDLPPQDGMDDKAMAAAAVVASVRNYHFVGIHYTRCHRLRELLPEHVRKILYVYDLDSAVLREESRLTNRPLHYSLREEVARMRDFDLIVTVGQSDSRAIAGLNPGAAVVSAPLRVDPGRPIRLRRSGKTLLWVSTDALFNRTSFEWFWRGVWPAVRRRIRGAELIIAGRISETALRLGVESDPRIRILGVVDDPLKVALQSDLLAAPYLYGEGIKTRIIDALSWGLPVITTPNGLTNTSLVPNQDIAVAQSPRAFAGLAVKLLDSEKLRRRMARKGREYVRRHHGPEALEPYRDSILEILSRPAREFSPDGVRPLSLQDELQLLVPRLIRRCRSRRIGRVALYGAGSHTEALLPLWREAGGPTIEAILVSEAPPAARFQDLPVIPVAEFDDSKVDAVVASSLTHERAMQATFRAYFPDTPFITIWTTDPD